MNLRVLFFFKCAFNRLCYIKDFIGFQGFITFFVLKCIRLDSDATSQKKFETGLDSIQSASDQLAKLHNQYGIKFDTADKNIEASKCPMMKGLRGNSQGANEHKFPVVKKVCDEMRQQNSRLPSKSSISC